jgi:hypothetical protein
MRKLNCFANNFPTPDPKIVNFFFNLLKKLTQKFKIFGSGVGKLFAKQFNKHAESYVLFICYGLSRICFKMTRQATMPSSKAWLCLADEQHMSPKGFQSPKFSDSDFREVRGLGRPKSSAKDHSEKDFYVKLFILAECSTTLRVFIEKFKKLENFPWIFFFSKIFWITALRMLQRVCLRKFGGSRPAGLGGDRHRTDST